LFLCSFFTSTSFIEEKEKGGERKERRERRGEKDVNETQRGGETNRLEEDGKRGGKKDVYER